MYETSRLEGTLCNKIGVGDWKRIRLLYLQTEFTDVDYVKVLMCSLFVKT